MAARSAAAAALSSLALAWPAAQALTLATPTSAFEAVGRGIQITADWVITAGHVARNPGDDYANGWGNRTVAARYDFDQSAFPQNDISLLRLESDPGASAVPDLPVLGQAVPIGSVSPAMAATIAVTAGASPRAFATTAISDSVFEIDPDGPGALGLVPVNWLVSLDAAVHVEGGDSGGALFAGAVTDSSVLIGIASSLIKSDLGEPLGSGFVQPAAYRSWIDATMTADLTDGQRVNWVAAVPEPSMAVLWLAGCGLLVGWRVMSRRARP